MSVNGARKITAHFRNPGIEKTNIALRMKCLEVVFQQSASGVDIYPTVTATKLTAEDLGPVAPAR